MALILTYADIIGGVLGIVGSIILAYPLFSEIADRQHWDRLSDFIRRHNAAGPKTAEEREAERSVRDHLLNSRLGRSQRHRVVTLSGLFVLLGAFVFMTLAAFERRQDARPPETHPAKMSSTADNCVPAEACGAAEPELRIAAEKSNPAPTAPSRKVR